MQDNWHTKKKSELSRWFKKHWTNSSDVTLATTPTGIMQRRIIKNLFSSIGLL